MFGTPSQQPSMPENNPEKEKLVNLAEELDKISRKLYPGMDTFMPKFSRVLRSGDLYAAKVFADNESDKLREYGEDTLALIISTLYGGIGSPWVSLEKKLSQKKP